MRSLLETHGASWVLSSFPLMAGKPLPNVTVFGGLAEANTTAMIVFRLLAKALVSTAYFVGEPSSFILWKEVSEGRLGGDSDVWCRMLFSVLRTQDVSALAEYLQWGDEKQDQLRLLRSMVEIMQSSDVGSTLFYPVNAYTLMLDLTALYLLMRSWVCGLCAPVHQTQPQVVKQEIDGFLVTLEDMPYTTYELVINAVVSGLKSQGGRSLNLRLEAISKKQYRRFRFMSERYDDTMVLGSVGSLNLLLGQRQLPRVNWNTMKNVMECVMVNAQSFGKKNNGITRLSELQVFEVRGEQRTFDGVRKVQVDGVLLTQRWHEAAKKERSFDDPVVFATQLRYVLMTFKMVQNQFFPNAEHDPCNVLMLEQIGSGLRVRDSFPHTLNTITTVFEGYGGRVTIACDATLSIGSKDPNTMLLLDAGQLLRNTGLPIGRSEACAITYQAEGLDGIGVANLTVSEGGTARIFAMNLKELAEHNATLGHASFYSDNSRGLWDLPGFRNALKALLEVEGTALHGKQAHTLASQLCRAAEAATRREDAPTIRFEQMLRVQGDSLGGAARSVQAAVVPVLQRLAFVSGVTNMTMRAPYIAVSNATAQVYFGTCCATPVLLCASAVLQRVMEKRQHPLIIHNWLLSSRELTLRALGRRGEGTTKRLELGDTLVQADLLHVRFGHSVLIQRETPRMLGEEITEVMLKTRLETAQVALEKLSVDASIASIKGRIKGLSRALQAAVYGMIRVTNWQPRRNHQDQTEMLITYYGRVIVMSLLLRQLGRAHGVTRRKEGWLLLTKAISKWNDVPAHELLLASRDVLTQRSIKFTTLLKNLIERLVIPIISSVVTLNHGGEAELRFVIDQGVLQRVGPHVLAELKHLPSVSSKKGSAFSSIFSWRIITGKSADVSLPDGQLANTLFAFQTGAQVQLHYLLVHRAGVPDVLVEDVSENIVAEEEDDEDDVVAIGDDLLIGPSKRKIQALVGEQQEKEEEGEERHGETQELLRPRPRKLGKVIVKVPRARREEYMRLQENRGITPEEEGIVRRYMQQRCRGAKVHLTNFSKREGISTERLLHIGDVFLQQHSGFNRLIAKSIKNEKHVGFKTTNAWRYASDETKKNPEKTETDKE
jgi:hypothetical protein